MTLGINLIRNPEHKIVEVMTVINRNVIDTFKIEDNHGESPHGFSIFQYSTKPAIKIS